MTTLNDDELARIKREVLDHVLAVGAEPYIGVRSIYSVIQDYVLSSSVAATTSATAVTAAGPTLLTLASVTGLASSSRVQLDVDGSRETVTVRAVIGSTVSVICGKTHSGTYPVEVESPLTIVRGLLADLASLEQRYQPGAWDSAGLKRVDEVEFFGRADGTLSAVLAGERGRLRAELAAACGIGAWYAGALSKLRGGSGSMEAY